jgi:serine/threonine-protein kinase RsbT
MNVLATHHLRLDVEGDIVVVRRRVRDIAELRKFDGFATAAITTAASELARNVIVHAGKGAATVDEVSDGARVGIRILFEDTGGGIPDLERVMRGGFSTARSMGLGLSGSKRLVDQFEIETSTAGTRITILKWKRF